MASREAAPRPEVKWERADIGEDEKNAPLPTPPGQAPPASAADDAEESEYITVESPYISIGELVDIGDDSDIDVDDEEESDDLFLNRYPALQSTLSPPPLSVLPKTAPLTCVDRLAPDVACANTARAGGRRVHPRSLAAAPCPIRGWGLVLGCHAPVVGGASMFVDH